MNLDMYDAFTKDLYYGTPTRSGAKTVMEMSKKTGNEKMTSLKPGEVVVYVISAVGATTGMVEKASATNTAKGCCCVYGVVVGVSRDSHYVSIGIKGYFVTKVDTATFAGATEVGHKLKCKEAEACHCKCGLLTNKVRALKPNGTSEDAFEVQF